MLRDPGRWGDKLGTEGRLRKPAWLANYVTQAGPRNQEKRRRGHGLADKAVFMEWPI